MIRVGKFWQKVQKCEHGQECDRCCWPWLGAVGSLGYGRTRSTVILGREETYAHRVAYTLATGTVAQHSVCHSCDNPRCCNPKHLWHGTHQQNMADCARKGRAARNNRPQKLTAKSVKAIRLAYTQGQKTRDIAKKYGVSQPLVSHIINRKVWAHVE